jgi:hypothetical protein
MLFVPWEVRIEFLNIRRNSVFKGLMEEEPLENL